MPDLNLATPMPTLTPAVPVSPPPTPGQLFDVSTITYPVEEGLTGEYVRIQAALLQFARELVALVHEIYPHRVIEVHHKMQYESSFRDPTRTRSRHERPTEFDGVSHGVLHIWLPKPSCCYSSYTASPLAARNRYTHRWFGDTQFTIRYKGRVALAAGQDEHIMCVFCSRRQILGELRGELVQHLRNWGTDAVQPAPGPPAQEEDKMLKFCKTMVKGRLAGLKTELEQIEGNINSTARTLETYFRQKIDAEDALRAGEEVTGKFMTEVRDGLLRLQKLIPGKYQSVVVGEKSITAITQPIHIDHRGRRYKMGYYRIIITPEKMSLAEQVVIRQADPQYIKNGNGHHPHIRVNYTCWGTINGKTFEHELIRMMNKMEYFGILFQLVMYLTYYNEASPLVSISNWSSEPIPVAEKEMTVHVKEEQTRTAEAENAPPPEGGQNNAGREIGLVIHRLEGQPTGEPAVPNVTGIADWVIRAEAFGAVVPNQG